MAEPLSPDASRFADLWYRRVMRQIDEDLATLRRLEAMEPIPRRHGRSLSSEAFGSLEAFEATLRQVLVWLDTRSRPVQKWRIALCLYRVAEQPPADRNDLARILADVDDARQRETARKFLARCEAQFGINMDAMIAILWREIRHG
jgi:hypothetical protein